MYVIPIFGHCRGPSHGTLQIIRSNPQPDVTTLGCGFFLLYPMKKTLVDYDPDELLDSMKDIDWSRYKEQRLSREQIERATTLVFDNPELKEQAQVLLENCFNDYETLRPMRDRSQLCIDFYKGEHWNQLMVDPDTKETMTQEQYIRNQGMVPSKQNQIRQVLKNMIGQFRSNNNKSTVIARNREDQTAGEMMTKTLHYALDLNDSMELDVNVFQQFLNTGVFGWKTSYKYLSDKNRSDIWLDSIHYARIFFNPGLTDPRLQEIHRIGEIHDVRLEDILKAFARNKADEQLIREWYGFSDNDRHRYSNYGMTSQDSDVIKNLDFYTPEDPSRCRLIEIWEKINMPVMIVTDPVTGKSFQSEKTEEELDAINEQRYYEGLAQGVLEEDIPLLEYELRYEDIWHFWFLTPQGDILMHGETPYDHEEHPYTLGLYPLIDGNIWGMTWDILDQQIQINRLLTQLDKIVGTSFKGATTMWEDMKADGWTDDDYAREFSKPDGFVLLKAPKDGSQRKPDVLSNNATNIGTIELLTTQMNLLREISGITDAIQGQKPNSGTPSSLYAQQTTNAALNNLDYFEFFNSKVKKRDLKIVKTQQQFYTEDRNIAIGGNEYDNKIQTYNAQVGKDLDVDVVMGQGTNSPAYRMLTEDILMKFLDQQLIDMDMYLEMSSMPFADKMRDIMNRKQQEIMQAQQQLAAQGMPTEPNPGIMQAIQQRMQGA